MEWSRWETVLLWSFQYMFWGQTFCPKCKIKCSFCFLKYSCWIKKNPCCLHLDYFEWHKLKRGRSHLSIVFNEYLTFIGENLVINVLLDIRISFIGGFSLMFETWCCCVFRWAPVHMHKHKSYTCFWWRVIWLCVTVDPKDISSTQQLLQQLKASKEEGQKSVCLPFLSPLPPPSTKN